jgi:outer membrane receptor protein involved in Fe transport
MSTSRIRWSRRLVAVVACVGTLSLPAASWAQATAATVRGRVLVEGRPASRGAAVAATNVDNGTTKRATTQADGTYALVGLDPGTYEILAAADGVEQKIGPVRVQIGQTIDLDLTVGSAAQPVDEVIVSAQRLVETRTSEIATNVTTEQIESLPQSSRNFLNFAALAPGVRVNDRDTEKTFQAGALTANAVNVYIDGASYKNQVLSGGLAGQDSSRGNPFPQNAVQEFRVATQNFNAEYEHATSAIITTLTRSGTNELEGDGFIYYQDKDLVARDDFAEPGEPRAEYERLQYGLSLGGPIIRDRMHFFVAFEGNDQDRANRVTLGNPAFEPDFGHYEGSFAEPFRQDLFFGKIDYRPTDAHALELSLSYRDETDIKNFGGQTSYEAARNVQNTVRMVRLAHTYDAESWINEASLSYLDYAWNPVPTNPGLIGRDYSGVIRLGGADTAQNIGQQVYTFKNDVTFTEVGNGRHVLKAGMRVAHLDYDVQKFQSGNPLFRFLPEVSFGFPGEAEYGTGNADLSDDTAQYGLYVQDDWEVARRWTLSLGVRWDYDTNMFNDGYVTPPDIVAATSSFVPQRYFTDGDDRESPDDLFQPRLGFSFDVTGDQRTVLFGGIGRYFDRVLYNETLDERLRLQWQVRRFLFSEDGAPRDGQPTIEWNDAYLSKAALDGLIAAGTAPNAEIFLLENDTRIPETIQASLGVRRRLGDNWVGSLTLARNRSRHGFSYILGNRNPGGTCCMAVPGNFGNVLLSTDDKQAWYDGVYLTLDKPFTGEARWGMTLAYTYSEAEANGGDLFSLDFPTIDDYPRHPTPGDERSRLVVSAIFGLPWDLKLSTLVTLGSGTGYTIVDQSAGTGVGELRYLYYTGRPGKDSFLVPDAWAYRSVDLRLQKSFRLGGRELSFVAEALNVFDYENFDPGSYNGIIPAPGEPPNADFGLPTQLVEPGRRLQLGVTFSF